MQVMLKAKKWHLNNFAFLLPCYPIPLPCLPIVIPIYSILLLNKAVQVVSWLYIQILFGYTLNYYYYYF